MFSPTTKSGESGEPTVVSRNVDWYEKSNSSTVRSKGRFAPANRRPRRAPTSVSRLDEKVRPARASFVNECGGIFQEPTLAQRLLFGAA